MSRPLPSTTLAAAVRTYFGLTQDDLAQYLGVSRAAVSHAEAGRNDFSAAVWQRLLPLAAGLPAASAAIIATVLPPELPLSAAATLHEEPVRRRLRRCEQQARHLRYTLENRYATYQHAQRWQQVLPGLLAQLPAPTHPWQQRQRRWLSAHAAEVADQLDAGALTDYRLLALRLQHLEAEAQELRRWLAGSHG